MATLVLGAVGASIGGSLSGTMLGLSGAVVGRAVGATVGRAIDQAILGQGAEVVEGGRIDRLRLTGASEGAVIPRVWGRVRLPGQVVWATRFREDRTTTGGSGKGAPRAPKQTAYSYSISLALALCEGPIRRVSRVWADGVELDWASIQMRVHHGTESQLPDALIEAVEGRSAAPAYRGTAYVVIEDLDLTPFGNRVPQLTFEVVRYVSAPNALPCAAELIRGVALVPGTGEYALATTKVHYDFGRGGKDSANVNTVQTRSDFQVAVRDLTEELPNLRSVSLVVSWFGDDLRCGHCRIRPKVEQNQFEGRPQRWCVSGLLRKDAQQVPLLDGRPVYGGTPGDAAVVEAIRDLNRRGIDVTFYPFILMEQMAGNGLANPWGEGEQPALPWRGRITTSQASNRSGTVDGTVVADAEVADFFGETASDIFSFDDDPLGVSGPGDDWSYRRFILHYAHLCALAGGVEAFCIGSEMRGLTSIRGEGSRFPAVEALRQLAKDVRRILPGAKIGYAADWSEYFGYRPEGSDDLYFHLDPLWGDPAIDFVGIDNYMPLSDWRDDEEHLDIHYRSGRSLEYLRKNVEGGEGFDWFYESDTARHEQRRSPISDGAYGEPWVFRYKDLKSWWKNAHYNRISGTRSIVPTGWVPRSKPIRFVEYGCAAIDKGANQPNKFIDAKSSESSTPWHSSGHRDDTMQQQYVRALISYWEDAANNATSAEGGRMIDLAHSFAWAWDTRPWPYFPQMGDHWTDGVNYARGHWLNGRSANQPLENVVREICASSGVTDVDVSAIHGVVRGYSIGAVQTARADLQPLLMAYGVEATERGGKLIFSMRADAAVKEIGADRLVRGKDGMWERARAPLAETAGTVAVHHFDYDRDHASVVSQVSMPGRSGLPVTETEVPLALTRGEANVLAGRFLAEAQIVRDTAVFELPPSRADIAVGDLLRFSTDEEVWRIDRLDDRGVRRVQAVRTERTLYAPGGSADQESGHRRLRPAAPLPVSATILDLPLLRAEDNPYAPYIALSGVPWPGSVAVHSAVEDNGYTLDALIDMPVVEGETLSVLSPAAPSIWDKGAALLVRFGRTGPASVSEASLFAGGNAAAIGSVATGPWEVFQFRDAQPVGEGIWALSMRLRGQRGTEIAAASAWPAGSRVVLLSNALVQPAADRDVLGLSRHYRVGPARLPLTDASYIHIEHQIVGAGLRPYAPVHLRSEHSDGARRVSWIRRSRFDHVAWNAADVPLGEARERYLVRLIGEKGRVLVEREVTQTSVVLTSREVAEASQRGVIKAIQVAQVSEEVGPGTWGETAFV